MSEQLANFQRSLNENAEEKNQFINAGNSDSDSESESETVRLVLPKKTKREHPIDAMLMEQLIKQQKAYLKAQKTIYKLQTEIDTEEVKTRYIKLDLNNAQVRIEELNKYVMKFYYACAVIFFLFTVFSARIIF
jgi:hypothetical protein